MFNQLVKRLHESEEGHAKPFGGALVAGIGMILVGIGAANDTGWLAVAGGIVGALGILAYDFLHHSTLDAEFFKRTDDLMGKK